MGTEQENELRKNVVKGSVITNSCEEHVVQQKSDGHYDQDKFPGLPGRVEICPDIGAGDILGSLGSHPDSQRYELDK